MRAATTPILLLAVLGLTACHKQAPTASDAPRGLKVEAYDVPIAKAPNKGGKLDVMQTHPEDAASMAPPPAPVASPPASSEPPADKPQAALTTGHRLAVQRVATPPAPKAAEPRFDLYDSPTYQTQKPAAAAPATAEPGFRITLPVCQRAERMGDPLAKTAECATLIDQGREQQRLCAQAFENGDDKAVLSEGCRQAARFR